MRKKYFGKGKEEKELLDRLREISKQDKTPEEVQAAIDSLLESDGISEWEESSSISSSISSDMFFQSEESPSEKTEENAIESSEKEVKIDEKQDHFDEHGNQVVSYESEQKDDSDVNEDVVLSNEEVNESTKSGSSESFELSFESDELQLAYESSGNKLFNEKDDNDIETKDEEINFVALESEIEVAEKVETNTTDTILTFEDDSLNKDESSSDSKNDISSFESNQLILEKNESEQVLIPDQSDSVESSSSESESSESSKETIDEEDLEPIAIYGSETKEESYDDLANFLFNDGDTESSSESSVEELEFVTTMSAESEQSEESSSEDMAHPPMDSHSIIQKNRGGNKMADFNFGSEEKDVESKDGIHTDFEVCEAVKSVEKTVRLKDQIRILKTRITIEDVCPDSNVAVAVLLIDEHGKTVGIRGGEFHVPTTGEDAYSDCDDNCTNLKVKFTFIVPEKNICEPRKLSIKVITHYTELPKH